MKTETPRTIHFRRILRMILCFISTAFSLYVGFNAYLIASAGVTSQVPQLEGDGGGGILVAALILVAGGMGFLRGWIAAIVYGLAAATAALVGLVFQDPTTILWGIGPVLLGVLTFLVERRNDRRRRLYLIGQISTNQRSNS